MELPDQTKLPASEPKAIIVNGTLIPDADSVRSILWTLTQQMKNNPDLADSFSEDPLKVLGSLGLNYELQIEAAQAFGVELAEGGAAAECYATCACTGCCYTSG